jgi:hypothetical protein
VAGRVTTLVGALLAGVVVAGTALYVGGLAPAYPWNGGAFNLLLLACLAFALAFGRARG